ATRKPKDFQPLGRVCVHAAELRGIPVVVEQRGEAMHTELRLALNILDAAGPRRGTSRAPAFRKPLLTVYNVGATLAALVITLGIVRFMVRWTELGQDIADAVAPPA